jgi:hypothetical protein
MKNKKDNILEFMGHDIDCDVDFNGKGKCVCGYAEAAAELEALRACVQVLRKVEAHLKGKPVDMAGNAYYQFLISGRETQEIRDALAKLDGVKSIDTLNKQ